MIFFSQFIKCNNRKIEFYNSYINLKTKGTDNIRFFVLPRIDYPTTIIINNKINFTNDISDSYDFDISDNNINNITLIWNKSLTSTETMFWNCEKIIEIDLSNFDTSSVTTMKSMFFGCSSLYSLDLSNFNTSSVTTMESMFSGCSSLYSLDLSNFDTSSVTTMESMFLRCLSLRFLMYQTLKLKALLQ